MTNILQTQFELMVTSTYDRVPTGDQLDQLRMAFFGGALVANQLLQSRSMTTQELDAELNRYQNAMIKKLTALAKYAAAVN